VPILVLRAAHELVVNAYYCFTSGKPSPPPDELIVAL